MRKHIVAGNWKMNNDLAETQELLSHIKMQMVKEPTCRCVCSTIIYKSLQQLSIFKKHPNKSGRPKYAFC